jgi:signal transduction histidine kinase
MPGFSSVGIRQIENKRECYGCHSPQIKINGLLVVDIDYAFAAGLLRANQVKGILIAFLSLTLLTIIVLRLFEKLINRPIHQMRKKMKEVQEGNLNLQLLPLNNDEIGTLAKSFNIMVARLREANQKIEELYEKQMEKAEHLAAIGELTAGLAHEIKNPIAGVKGALEIIHQKTDTSDPRREVFAEILFQIDRIYKIIQDLLSYARPKDINVSLTSPNECIQNAIKLARTQMNGKDIQFHFTGLKENALAAIDTNKIQELILNMMLNSISAIDNEGNIEIGLQQRNERELEIIVADDGGGIKEEIAPQIFNPFFTTKPRGTGLGLSICKKIIEVHRGSVEVKSKSGEGTTFIIRLPVLQPSD